MAGMTDARNSTNVLFRPSSGPPGRCGDELTAFMVRPPRVPGRSGLGCPSICVLCVRTRNVSILPDPVCGSRANSPSNLNLPAGQPAALRLMDRYSSGSSPSRFTASKILQRVSDMAAFYPILRTVGKCAVEIREPLRGQPLTRSRYGATTQKGSETICPHGRLTDMRRKFTVMSVSVRSTARKGDHR